MKDRDVVLLAGVGFGAYWLVDWLKNHPGGLLGDALDQLIPDEINIKAPDVNVEIPDLPQIEVPRIQYGLVYPGIPDYIKTPRYIFVGGVRIPDPKWVSAVQEWGSHNKPIAEIPYIWTPW